MKALACYLFVGFVVTARGWYLARRDPRLRWWHAISNVLLWPLVICVAIMRATSSRGR
jgi:hypothetical protein